MTSYAEFRQSIEAIDRVIEMMKIDPESIEICVRDMEFNDYDIRRNYISMVPSVVGSESSIEVDDSAVYIVINNNKED